MFKVHYTVFKSVRGESTNVYKCREFASYSDATAFYNKIKGRANVTDVRLLA